MDRNGAPGGCVAPPASTRLPAVWRGWPRGGAERGVAAHPDELGKAPQGAPPRRKEGAQRVTCPLRGLGNSTPGGEGGGTHVHERERERRHGRSRRERGEERAQTGEERRCSISLEPRAARRLPEQMGEQNWTAAAFRGP